MPTAEQVATFITTARGDLERLAADLAAAQAHDADGDEVQILYRRFTELQATTTRHAELLQCALDDVQGALELVRMQITGLLAGTGLTP